MNYESKKDFWTPSPDAICDPGQPPSFLGEVLGCLSMHNVDDLDGEKKELARRKRIAEATDYAFKVIVEQKNQDEAEVRKKSLESLIDRWLFVARDFDEMRHFSLAEDLCHKALNKCREDLGEHVLTASVLNLLGAIISKQSREREGIKYLREALSMRVSLFGEKSEWTANTMFNMCFTLTYVGELEEAMHFARESCKIRFELCGYKDEGVGHCEIAIGMVLHAKGRLLDGIESTQAGIATLGRSRATSVAKAYGFCNLCDMYLDMNEPEQAKKMVGFVLKDLHRKKLGNHPAMSRCWSSYSRVSFVLEDFDQAFKAAHIALGMNESCYEGDHAAIAQSMNNVGWLSYAGGLFEQAEEKHSSALAMAQRLHEGDHPEISVSLINLGATKFALKKFDESWSLNMQSLEMSIRMYGKEHRMTICAYENLKLLQKEHPSEVGLELDNKLDDFTHLLTPIDSSYQGKGELIAVVGIQY